MQARRGSAAFERVAPAGFPDVQRTFLSIGADIMSTSHDIAVLGLGAMGSRMAVALLRAGHRVTVWNRNAEKAVALGNAGARIAGSPRSAVAGADFVICMVRDDHAAREVWLDPNTGALSGMRHDAIGIESSTLSLAAARALAGEFAARGIAFLDAPVAGSRPQAEAGQLIYLVGGDDDIVERATPVLLAIGGSVRHAGAAGAGAAVKLMVNTLFGVQLAVLGEMLGLLERSGIDPQRAHEIFAATPVCSPAANAAGAAMLAGNYAPMFPIELVAKDLGYTISASDVVNAQAPVAHAAATAFDGAVREGYGTDNITGIIQRYR
jgi:3-hydroxyisobutyrate dehydrogenase